jgi:cytochrome oxidase Cu insertion factor (SCO1/SenC/PrrC family)
MPANSKLIRFISWSVLTGAILAIIGLFAYAQVRRSDLPIYGSVGNFTLTNQAGHLVSAKDLQGKVWVGDIIFSRCAGPCPKMTEQMALIQAAFSGSPALHLVTLTTDPDYDTPAILNAYGKKFQADADRWSFLTGAKEEIRKLAVDGLKLTTVEKGEAERETPADLFIHSTIFVLVDKHGQLRGVYESLEPGFQEKISKDIRAVLREA